MSNKLVKVDADLLIKSTKDISDFLKPLSRDIFLFSTCVGSIYKIKDKTPLFNLKVKDVLNFRHKQNLYDANEIQIINEKEELIGFVPESDSAIFARLMEAGKKLFASVENINLAKTVPLITINIYLKDY